VEDSNYEEEDEILRKMKSLVHKDTASATANNFKLNDESHTIDNVIDLYNHVFVNISSNLSKNVKWILSKMHRRISKEFDRDVHSNSDIVSQYYGSMTGTKSSFSYTGRKNDDDVCILMGTLICERILLPMLRNPFKYKLWNSDGKIIFLGTPNFFIIIFILTYLNTFFTAVILYF
jgi:hypothetical protein